MENKEDILKALIIIQNVCKENEDCETCPLEQDYCCAIQNHPPEKWKLRKTEVWKAFENER